MKTVLKNHSEVAHVWAQQKQDNGRSGNMFFEGPSIFSYGHHFEIARFVGDVVLFTTRDYSSSTRKHKSYTKRAVSHKTVFIVPSFTDHNANVEYHLSEITRQIAEIKRAQYTGYRINTLNSTYSALKEYVRVFKKEISADNLKQAKKVLSIAPFTDAEYDALKTKEEKFKAGQEARAKIRYAARDARYKAAAERREEIARILELWEPEINELNIHAWKAGVTMPYGWGNGEMPIALRLAGDSIETSQGAYVPIETAKTLYGKLKARECLEGFEIGHYTVSGIHDGKLIVGCHRISLLEIAKMAVTLGIAA